jgi:MOSC domain-containing protein YiiM
MMEPRLPFTEPEAPPVPSGLVIAVSLSPRHGFSKQPQPGIRLVPGEGVEGDAHRGVTVQHLYQVRRNPAAPNLSQVHLFPAEMLSELAARGFALEPGALGENILAQGLDLLALPRGTLLHIGSHALLELTGLRTPCSKIDDLRPGLQAQLWGPDRTRRAGVMSIVHHGGDVHPGDPIRVELPAQPHQPLRPV